MGICFTSFAQEYGFTYRVERNDDILAQEFPYRRVYWRSRLTFQNLSNGLYRIIDAGLSKSDEPLSVDVRYVKSEKVSGRTLYWYRGTFKESLYGQIVSYTYSVTSPVKLSSLCVANKEAINCLKEDKLQIDAGIYNRSGYCIINCTYRLQEYYSEKELQEEKQQQEARAYERAQEEAKRYQEVKSLPEFKSAEIADQIEKYEYQRLLQEARNSSYPEDVRMKKLLYTVGNKQAVIHADSTGCRAISWGDEIIDNTLYQLYKQATQFTVDYKEYRKYQDHYFFTKNIIVQTDTIIKGCGGIKVKRNGKLRWHEPIPANIAQMCSETFKTPGWHYFTFIDADENSSIDETTFTLKQERVISGKSQNKVFIYIGVLAALILVGAAAGA